MNTMRVLCNHTKHGFLLRVSLIQMILNSKKQSRQICYDLPKFQWLLSAICHAQDDSKVTEVRVPIPNSTYLVVGLFLAHVPE